MKVTTEITMHTEGLLASVASPPSDLNGRFFYIFICDRHCTYRYVLLILRALSLSLSGVTMTYSKVSR